MKLNSKITAFVLSCFLLQGQVYAGSRTEMVDTQAKLENTMAAARTLLEISAGHNFTAFLNLVNGNDTAVNDKGPSESGEKLEDSRLIVVEKKDDGKIVIIASRGAASEIGIDLTADPVHQGIVEKLKGENYTGTATVFYTDKTGAAFQVLAWGVRKLDKNHSRDIYLATETKISKIPDGEVDANAEAIKAAQLKSKL